MNPNGHHRPGNSSSQFPLPAPELHLLNVFVGSWHAEGNSYGDGQSEDDPFASSEQWTSNESYEWMSGNYFLLHRWNARVGDHQFKGLEIMGYDVAKKEFFTRFFDNNGNAIKYAVLMANNIWTLTEPHTRARIIFHDNGNTMILNWEWKHEGGDWLPLCNRKAIKKK
jgi:hypothetical protein